MDIPTKQEFKDALESVKNKTIGWAWGFELDRPVRGYVVGISRASFDIFREGQQVHDFYPRYTKCLHFSLTKPVEKPKRGDKVLVRYPSQIEWLRRYVSHFEGDVVYCYCNGKTEWSSGPSSDPTNEPAIGWSLWKLPEVD